MSSTSTLRIVLEFLKQGGADKETISSLENIWKTTTKAVSVFGALATVGVAVDQVYQNTTKVFLDYADQVRDTSRLTGASTENTSRLIQMADDLGIAYDSLQKSLWYASKNGIEISIESLAKLADQYTSFDTATERATFLAKTFGKSGEDMGKFLAVGGDGLKKLSAVQEQGLILTAEQVKKARELEIAQDDLSDAWKAAQVTLGSAFTPAVLGAVRALNDLMNMSGDAARAHQILAEQEAQGIVTKRGSADAALAQAKAEREAADGLKDNEVALTNHTEALDGDRVAAMANAGAVDDAAASEDHYADALKAAQKAAEGKLGNEMDLTKSIAEYGSKLADLNAQYADETKHHGANSQGAKDVAQQIHDLQKAHEQQTAEWMLGMMQQGGATAAQQQKFAEMTGLVSSDSKDAVDALATIQNALGGDTDEAMNAYQAVKSIIDNIQDLDGMSATAIVNIIVHGSVPHLDNVVHSTRGGSIVTPYAEGGVLGAMSEVGEAGSEGVIQRADGSYVVIPHTAWVEMKRLGLTQDAPGFGGGGRVPFTVRNREHQGNNPVWTWRSLNARQHNDLGGNGGGGANPNRQDEESVKVDVPAIVASLSAPTEAAAQATATVAAAASFQTQQLQASADRAQAGNDALISEIRELRTALSREIGAAVKMAV